LPTSATSATDRSVAGTTGRCILCGDQGLALYTGLVDSVGQASGTWGFLRCRRCGLLWLTPRPLPADMEKLYAGYHTHACRPPQPFGWREVAKRMVLCARLHYHCEGVGPLARLLGRALALFGPVREAAERSVLGLSRPADGGVLLDVGCGNGAFLARMQRLGWQVAGVEPDPEAAEVARRHPGVYVHAGTLHDAQFRDEQFDAVTLQHVLEHVLEPVETLRECARVLRPGGSIIVITPNVESLGHRLFGKAWRGLEPPRHVYLFNGRTLTDAAEKAGLHVLRCATTSYIARWMWAASRILAKEGRLPGGSAPPGRPAHRLLGLLFQMTEYSLAHVYPVGEELVLVATKTCDASSDKAGACGC